MTVTIKDIARRTGKSITTVSRALNDYDDVSAGTKALVRKVADEMGYTPNLLAQRLQKRRTDTIGLILPTFGPRFADPFFSELLAGVGNKAAEYGYDLLVSTQAPGANELASYKRKVEGRQVDGFVVVRTRRQDERISYLVSQNVPLAVFGRTEDGLDFPHVDEDSVRGLHMIIEHLAGLGHSRIACLAPPFSLMFTKYRLQGVREGLQVHGLTLTDEYLVFSDLTQRGGFAAAEQLLDLPEPPTAIVACNDLMALGAMSAIQRRGLIVGEDIAVTGFDDIPMAEHSHPPLTTVRQPIYQIGAMVCEMLMDILQGKSLATRSVILKPSLMVRQSSGIRQPSQPKPYPV